MFLHRLPFLLLASLASLSLASSAPFENSAIVRTIELGGSLVHVTTTYAVKALQPGAKTYTIALTSSERERTAWLEATIKGHNVKLPVEESELDHNLYVPCGLLPVMQQLTTPTVHTIS